MELRRLNGDDQVFYEEISAWDRDYPRWYKDSIGPWPERDDQANVGVFEGNQLIGLISIVPEGHQCYEAYLRAKRGSRVDVLAEAAVHVRNSLRTIGMREVFMWVCSRNRPVKTLCALAGMVEDGLKRIEADQGRLWEYLRYTVS